MVNIRNHFFIENKFFFFLVFPVASKITTASGQLVQRIRLCDEEEHPMQNNIITDTNLLQYYHLLADRGDPQAQVNMNLIF